MRAVVADVPSEHAPERGQPTKKTWWIRFLGVVGRVPEELVAFLALNVLCTAVFWWGTDFGVVTSACLSVGLTTALAVLVTIIWRS
jgi:hypothetical protein